MFDEQDNFERLYTHEVIAIPKDAKHIGSMRDKREKRNPVNKSKRFKSRLVASGFSQVTGFDY
jgi:hypothetical protein